MRDGQPRMYATPQRSSPTREALGSTTPQGFFQERFTERLRNGASAILRSETSRWTRGGKDRWRATNGQPVRERTRRRDRAPTFSPSAFGSSQELVGRNTAGTCGKSSAERTATSGSGRSWLPS